MNFKNFARGMFSGYAAGFTVTSLAVAIIGFWLYGAVYQVHAGQLP